nr:hypothetical protein [Pseudomonas sp. R5(2019)]
MIESPPRQIADFAIHHQRLAVLIQILRLESTYGAIGCHVEEATAGNWVATLGKEALQGDDFITLGIFLRRSIGNCSFVVGYGYDLLIVVCPHLFRRVVHQQVNRFAVTRWLNFHNLFHLTFCNSHLDTVDSLHFNRRSRSRHRHCRISDDVQSK